MSQIAKTPEPPYYAVIFTSHRTDADEEGYGTMADRMVELATQQPGYLGHESQRGPDGFGITVSYWDSLEAIRNWKANEEHLGAQARGRSGWYSGYTTRICRVEREYSFPR